MIYKTVIKKMGCTAIAFVLAYILSVHERYMLSGIVLGVNAVILTAVCFSKSKRLLDPAAFFTISWLGGMALSAMKLSWLQTDWSYDSWISFYLAYACFVAGYELGSSRRCGAAVDDTCAGRGSGSIFLSAINIVLVISVAAFIIEAFICGYIPLFTEDTPHAYSYFHVSGLHYFTVSCTLIPSLIVIYIRLYRDEAFHNRFIMLDLGLCMAAALILPLLLVSRFQLLYGILLACLTYLAVHGGRPGFTISFRTLAFVAAGFVMLIAAYVFITYERAHSIEYLNGIFEMKNAGLPIFVTQPYIYIANNYDNFNALTEGLLEHTCGLKMLFPVFALTGMKFNFPELVSFPLYVTKEELTTLTLFYDAYYDFGVAGVAGLALATGLIIALIEKRLEKVHYNAPVLVFIYAQLSFYLLFSFFTTWFSNPTTWFYIIASIAIGVYVKVISIWAER